MSVLKSSDVLATQVVHRLLIGCFASACVQGPVFRFRIHVQRPWVSRSEDQGGSDMSECDAGSAVYDDVTRYVGQWSRGLRHGAGKCMYYSGDRCSLCSF